MDKHVVLYVVVLLGALAWAWPYIEKDPTESLKIAGLMAVILIAWVAFLVRLGRKQEPWRLSSQSG